ncbi:MAG TPA: hypothetical protein VF707_15610 [Ardenticatenaceae bacterium]|jgi:hypothetical protein
MEEWSDWVVDGDPTEMVRQMRGVLADRRRSREDKVEALAWLTNLADEESVEVLRWYHEHADPGMELTSLLALMEANRLNRPPQFEPWHDTLLEKIHEIGEAFRLERGSLPQRGEFLEALLPALREEGWQVEEGGRALLKYDGQLVDLAPLELVINGQMLVGLWDRDDEDALEEMVVEDEDEEDEDEETFDPLDRFYATLRAANLPWGVQVDISGDTVFTDLVENIDLDRGTPRVEYVLALPSKGIQN